MCFPIEMPKFSGCQMAPLIPLRGHQPGESQGPTDGLRLKRFQGSRRITVGQKRKVK